MSSQAQRGEIILEELMETYEKMVIQALLTNEDELWTEAHAFACAKSFSPQQLQKCHLNVERWLRHHGVTPMEDHEKTAVLTIQSSIRRWIVYTSLKQQYNMYSRLAKLDSPDHCRRAMALERTLTYAWHYIHSR